MPLYEYECKKCHHRFERMQKFSDPHVKKCPKCNGPVEQVISAPAVQFKGSGWYVTDYSRKSHASSSSEGDHKEKADDKTEKVDKTEKHDGETSKAKKPEKSQKTEKAK